MPCGWCRRRFFMGGGTTCVVAVGARIRRETVQKEKRDETTAEHVKRVLTCGAGSRRFVGCDASRVAVAITADRITKVVEETIGKLFPVADFTTEHWGVYESPRLEKLPREDFRKFVIQAFGGRMESATANIHGLRAGVPLYVGEPSRTSQIGKEDVRKFAQAIFEEKRTEFGVMLGRNFDMEARRAVEILKARENKRIDFVRLQLIRLEDKKFREHIINKHKDYAE